MAAPSKPDRILLVDSLRGFALLGLFLVHSVELYELFWVDPQFNIVFNSVFGLFAGKAYALFALCFGLSFYIIMESAAARGQKYTLTFLWRLTLLLGFGILHSLLYRGDVLMVLAVFGYFLVPLDRIKNNWILLALAILLFLQLPLLYRAWAAMDGQAWALAAPLYAGNPSDQVMAHGGFFELVRSLATDGQAAKWWFTLESGRAAQILGLYIVGLLLGRIRFFREPDRFVRARLIALGVATGLWLSLWAAQVHLFPGVAAAYPPAARHLGQALENVTQMALLSVQVLVFIELYLRFNGAVLGLLAAAGRMTLTLYIGQSIIFVPIYYHFGLGLYDKMSSSAALAIGVVAFVLQLVLAHWWFKRFYYGPLEWLWRAGTRRTLDIPFIRRSAATPT